MKKIFGVVLFMALMSTAAQAGGLMTNTNYHIAFDRMFARGATSEIDAAYSNPAGLAWGHEGWQVSLNFQKPWQYRDIKLGDTKYEGKASAPIVPALFASYKKDRLAISTMIGIVGSGGFVEYKQGVPMFNVLLQSMLAANGIMPNQYTLNSEMKGKQYIYGGQLNFTYKILDCLSAAAGIRANYYDGYYRGHVIASDHPQLGEVAKLLLDVDQKGWGFTPLVSLSYHQGPLTLSARYEFRTKVNPKNDTNVLDAGLGTATIAAMMAADPQGAQAKLQALQAQLGTYTTPYQDGVRTRYDMPALLSVAAGYEFTPKLRGALEYHFFDDRNAKMANDRQKELEHGTHEFLAGVEYDINDKFTVSCGGQRTDYGLSDGYQQNTSFACDSYSVGLGGAWNINEKVRLNASYFCSIYSDYEKQASYGMETYSRTNHVIGVGIDYKF
ncbi:MAG: outer membrane beta-barrel protein [Prevotella sp.]|nr:outer membrane beta-barrel protein [Prevotella sp.]